MKKRQRKKPHKMNGSRGNGVEWVGKQQAVQDERDQFLFDDFEEEEDEDRET